MFEFIAIKDEGYGDINPVQFGFEDCEKSHSYGPAARYHWLIHYVYLISEFILFSLYYIILKISTIFIKIILKLQ